MPRVEDGRLVGIPNEDFTPEEAARLGELFGAFAGKGAVVVSGRDYNPSSRMLKRAFTAGLMSAGVEVMDFHEALCGEISFSIKRLGARAGFVFATYSRRRGAIVLRTFASPGAELVGSGLSWARGEARRAGPGEVGWVMYSEYVHKLYASALLSFVKSDEIAAREFKVVASAAYSPADLILPEITKPLGIDLTMLTGARSRVHEASYPFVREVERVSRVVGATGADLGVVFGNDGSSLALVDDKGRVLLPDEVAYALSLLAPPGSSILFEGSAAGGVAKLMEARGVRVSRASNEEDLAARAARERPFLAYRQTGEFSMPLFSLGYDAVLVVLRVLEALSLAQARLSAVVDEARRATAGAVKRAGEEEVAELCAKQGCRSEIHGYLVGGPRPMQAIAEPEEGGFLLAPLDFPAG